MKIIEFANNCVLQDTPRIWWNGGGGRLRVDSIVATYKATVESTTSDWRCCVA